MKHIRIIALIMCLLMVAPLVVACGNGNDTTTTTTTTTTTSGDNGGEVVPPPPAEPLTVFESYEETFAEGFSKQTEGSAVVTDGKIVINNALGAYHVVDDNLVLNSDNYSSIKISFDMKFDSFSSGNISIVSPLFYIDGEMKAQFFLKVDASGMLYYHACTKWAQQIKGNDGLPMMIQEGKSYNVRVEYDIEYGSYAIFLDDVQIEDDVLEFIMDEDVTQFTIRFMDNNAGNGACSVALSNVEIVAEP